MATRAPWSEQGKSGHIGATLDATFTFAADLIVGFFFPHLPLSVQLCSGLRLKILTKIHQSISAANSILALVHCYLFMTFCHRSKTFKRECFTTICAFPFSLPSVCHGGYLSFASLPFYFLTWWMQERIKHFSTHSKYFERHGQFDCVLSLYNMKGMWLQRPADGVSVW